MLVCYMMFFVAIRLMSERIILPMVPSSDENANTEPAQSSPDTTIPPLSASLARAAGSPYPSIEPVSADQPPGQQSPDGIPTLGSENTTGRRSRRSSDNGSVLSTQSQPQDRRARLMITALIGLTLIVFVASALLLSNPFSRKPVSAAL